MRSIPIGVIVSACAVSAVAQSPLHSVSGSAAGDNAGYAVAGVGDVNGDGNDDFLVASPLDDTAGIDAGQVRVYSGLDGSVLHTFDGASAGDNFGWSASGAGDVDGDGFADIIVGAPLNSTVASESGQVVVISGKTGLVLYTLDGLAADDHFGWSVSGAGDVNADGYADVIIGAPLVNGNGVDSGGARVISGLDGSTLFGFGGAQAGANFGWSVAGAGDVDADGFADVAVGAPLDDREGVDAGSMTVISGQTGTAIYVASGPVPGMSLGWSVARVGDLNGDGESDVAVGAPLDDLVGTDAGRAFVMSGQAGTVLYEFRGEAGDNLGWSVAGVGDLDRDGTPDLAVGAPLHAQGGTAGFGVSRVFSGVDGNQLWRVDGASMDDNAGHAVAGAGDVNGDGFDDYIVGVPGDDTAGPDAGLAEVYGRAPLESFSEVSRIAPLTQSGAYYGIEIGLVGDVDNDGIQDYGIGAPFDIAKFGSVRIYSGADDSVLYTHIGSAFDIWFGIRVGAAGDVDKDGFDDYMVGAWHDNTVAFAAGMARVYSGQTGVPIYEFFGPSVGAHLGSCLGNLGDLDGDTYPDFFIGVGEENSQTGSVWVYSGQTGTKMYEVDGDAAGDWFGWSGTAVDDVNGDGYIDFVCGAPQSTQLESGGGGVTGTGYARMVSGIDGSTLYTVSGVGTGDEFGWRVDTLGDIDLDGVGDFIVGAYAFDAGAKIDAGQARVFSGVDGSLIFNLVGNNPDMFFGAEVGPAGDINRDGFPDFFVGASNADPNGLGNAGMVFVFSGEDASGIQIINGDGEGDEFGRAVVSLERDDNGDHYNEFVIGVPKDDGTALDIGSVRYIQTNAKADPAWFRNFGSACPGSSGALPTLTFSDRPAIGESFDIDLTLALPSAPITLGLNVTNTSLDLAFLGAPSCFLEVIPVISVPLGTDPQGAANVPLALPNDNQFVGLTFYVEWLILDAGANAAGLVTTVAGAVNMGNP